MATANSQLSIANQAIIMLGAEPITSFDDESVQASSASSIYETTKRALLIRVPWRFAMRQANLVEDANPPLDVPNNRNWQHAWKLPSDLLQLKQVFDRPPYEVYGQRIYTNQNTCTIDYWFDTPENELPEDVVQVLVLQLAAMLAMPITEERTKLETFHEMAEMALGQATARDLMSRPEEHANNNVLLQVRNGGGSSPGIWNDGTWK